jgi:hypothetical protein
MIRRLLLPLALFALSIPAHAQLGAYGLFTVDRMSGIQSSPLLAPGIVYNDHVNPLGFTGGVLYDFKTFGPVRLGVDLRGSATTTLRGAQADSDGSGARIYSGLGGVRASFRTRYSFLKPYLQASAGIGRSNFGVLNNASVSTPIRPGIPLSSGLEYHAYAGLDIPILPYVDFRVAEFGYGAIHTSGTAGHTYPIESVSTGIVIHFPPPQ